MFNHHQKKLNGFCLTSGAQVKHFQYWYFLSEVHNWPISHPSKLPHCVISATSNFLQKYPRVGFRIQNFFSPNLPIESLMFRCIFFTHQPEGFPTSIAIPEAQGEDRVCLAWIDTVIPSREITYPLQGGPLPFINGLITPINGLING